MTYGEGDKQKEKEEINLLEVCFSIRGKSMEFFLLSTEFSSFFHIFLTQFNSFTKIQMEMITAGSYEFHHRMVGSWTVCSCTSNSRLKI